MRFEDFFDPRKLSIANFTESYRIVYNESHAKH